MKASGVFRSAVILAAAVSLAACGGGGGTVTATKSAGQNAAQAANAVAVAVDGGPTRSGCVNCMFTSVTVCAPGSATYCQAIDGILLDTGSTGLRLVSAGADGKLTINLPREQNDNGDDLAECSQYLDSSYSWGAVRVADVKLGGETAARVPIDVLSDPDVPASSAPVSCAGTGGFDESTVAALGANGILGVGTYEYDCGAACVSGGSPPVDYYDCPSGGTCSPAFVTLAKQLPNPVARFAKDNNGVILDLPAVQIGAADVTGSMIFGIDTQTNNALGGALVFPVTPAGNFTGPVVFAGRSFSAGFIDSGSNGLFFTNVTGIQPCGLNTGFYCPNTPLTLTATNPGSGGQGSDVTFQVVNADQLFANDSSDWAFRPLAGPYPAGQQGFDWGVPFFFGRRVYVAIENRPTSSGSTGPFWAY